MTNFAGEPLGASILLLARRMLERGQASDDDTLRIGLTRALMRAMSIRIRGVFDELEEKTLVRRNELDASASDPGLFQTLFRRIVDAHRQDQSVRGGFIEGSSKDGTARHAVAFLIDAEDSTVRVYNWGVEDARHQLIAFTKRYPLSVEVVAYALPSEHVRRLDFGYEAVLAPKSGPHRTVTPDPPPLRFWQRTWWKKRLRRLVGAARSQSPL